MPSNLPAIKRHLFLTGEKQVGKSTLLRKVIDACQLDCAGFETQAFDLNGERRGFTLHGRVEMPPYENDCICCARIEANRSVPVLPVFDINGAHILQKSIASASPFILMDELGKLERKSESFVSGIFAALDSGKRVLGVLQKCRSEHIELIMQREDVTIITVTPENRDALAKWLISQFKETK